MSHMRPPRYVSHEATHACLTKGMEDLWSHKPDVIVGHAGTDPQPDVIVGQLDTYHVDTYLTST